MPKATIQGCNPDTKDDEACLPLGERLGWLDELTNGLHVGSTTLIAGSPGGGKSRLANQIMLAAAEHGIASLVVMTEEAPERLDRRLVSMTGDWRRKDAQDAIGLIRRTDEVVDLEQLPIFLAHHVLSCNGRFAGTQLLVIDSVQGDGVAANAARKYARYYEACRLAKSADITVISIGQITKRNQLAGPRGLEHFVDLVVRIEKVSSHRICAITKNRHGAEKPRGIPLFIDPITITLQPSPHGDPVTGACRTFMGGAVGDVELQASVSLPMPGTRAQTVAPGLPRRRIEQLVNSLCRMPVLNLEQFDLNVNALLPGEARFRSWLGLPLAIALIASCIRRPVPKDFMLVGEVDLSRELRPLPLAVLDALALEVAEGRLGERVRLVVPRSATMLITSEPGIQVFGCTTLDQAVLHIWPDLH